MRNQELRSLTVYLSVTELAHICDEAPDHGVSVSADVRAQLGFPVLPRGAHIGQRRRRPAAAYTAPARAAETLPQREVCCSLVGDKIKTAAGVTVQDAVIIKRSHDRGRGAITMQGESSAALGATIFDE